MKLYTEEQLLNTIIAVRYYDNVEDDEKVANERIEKHLKSLQPIELPSDEEICKEPKYWGRLYKIGFVDGKKWFSQYLLDKIGGNK